jgi:hypothetical protein
MAGWAVLFPVSCQFVKIHFHTLYPRSDRYDRNDEKPYQASGIIRASVGPQLLALTNAPRYRPEARYKLKK